MNRVKKSALNEGGSSPTSWIRPWPPSTRSTSQATLCWTRSSSDGRYGTRRGRVREEPCPQEKVEPIREALRHFGMVTGSSVAAE